MKIYSYVVARDYGFAPNPFYGYCTLATCKPLIRKHAKIGDIIIGTRSTPRDYDLVFWMEVIETMSFDDYWSDNRFINKIPNLYAGNKKAFGDNIYHRGENGIWLQEDSHHTNYDGSSVQKNIDTDTSGENVLISENFSYWGEESIPLPKEFHPIKKVGPGHKSDFPDLLKLSVVNWLKSQERGFLGKPIEWKK